MNAINDVHLGMHLLEVEITTRCNLNCKHCYNRSRVTLDMPVEDIIKLIGWSEKYGLHSVVISGGEASLHPNFKELTKWLLVHQPKVRTVIQSNGAIQRQNLESIKAFQVVHLSLEPDDSNVRKKSGNKTITTALKLKSFGINVYLFATIHANNFEKIDWMVEIARSSNIDIGFNLCSYNGCNEHLLLSKEQRILAERKLYGLYLEKKILRFTSPLVAVFDKKKAVGYIGIKGGCTAGIAACVVLVNGSVAPCPFLRISAGNIYEDSLENIWLNSDIFSILRKRKEFDDPCGSCKFISYCGGCRKVALDRTGKVTGADPSCLL